MAFSLSAIENSRLELLLEAGFGWPALDLVSPPPMTEVEALLEGYRGNRIRAQRAILLRLTAAEHIHREVS